MINITSNINVVTSELLVKLNALQNPDQMLRMVSTNLLAEIKQRIHVDGKAADGSQIGTYSKGYMAVRTGQFKSNGTAIKGKDKGQTRTKGVFTKGKNKGAARPNFNRTADPKVIISLTGQMENDFSVVATQTGYGLGYNNTENANKVEYVEHTYGKKIFALTADEHDQAIKTAEEFVDNIVKS